MAHSEAPSSSSAYSRSSLDSRIWKLFELFLSRVRRPAIAFAPLTFRKPGTSRLKAWEGCCTASGSRKRAFRPILRRLSFSKASAKASGSPRYQASSSWHTILTVVSGRPATLHDCFSCCLRRTQSPPSLSLRMTKCTPGSLQARSLRGMLLSRSLLPSWARHRKFRSGYKRGSSPFNRSRMDASSSKKTTLFTRAVLLRVGLASRASRANRIPLVSKGRLAGRLRGPGLAGVRSPTPGGYWKSRPL